MRKILHKLAFGPDFPLLDSSVRHCSGNLPLYTIFIISESAKLAIIEINGPSTGDKGIESAVKDWLKLANNRLSYSTTKKVTHTAQTRILKMSRRPLHPKCIRYTVYGQKNFPSKSF